MGLTYHLLAWLYLRLTPGKFLGAVGPDLGDPLFNLSILRWVAERARHGFEGLWNPTFFYPIQGALALSDHLIGPGVLVGALDLAGLPPAATYNALLLLAFGASALAAHWVFEKCGLSFFASSLGALLWSFSGIRWSELSHIQVLFAPFVPLTLWSFSRLLERPERKRALTFGAFYLANLLGGSYLAYMTHFPLLVYFVVQAARRGERRIDLSNARSRLVLGSTALFMAVAIALVFGPYLSIGKSMGLRPKLSELAVYMVTTKSFVTAGPRTLYADWLPAGFSSERGVWPGFLIAGLGLFGAIRYLMAGRRDRRRRILLAALFSGIALLALAASDLRFLAFGLTGAEAQRDARGAFRATILVTLLALALFARFVSNRREAEGQELESDDWWRGLLWSGIVCTLLAHVAFFAILRGYVPGLEAIRDPARFLTFATFAAAGFAARGIDELRHGVRSSRRVLEAGLLVAAVLECVPRSAYLDWRAVPGPRALPPEYAWVRSEPSVRAIVELPLLENWREAERMYFWSLHRRPLVNGYSGYLPVPYTRLVESLGSFPSRAATRALSDLGVTHLIVHLDQLSRAERNRWSRWRSKLDSARDPWVVRVRELGSAEIYEIAPAMAPAAR